MAIKHIARRSTSRGRGNSSKSRQHKDGIGNSGSGSTGKRLAAEPAPKRQEIDLRNSANAGRLITMNPLDVSETVKPIEDIPGGFPLAVQGIPGVISADSVTQNFVDVLCSEVQKANDYAWMCYEGLLTQWKSNNDHGIYHPAPGPVTLASVNRTLAGQWLQKGTGGAGIISYYQQYEPEIPPGTIQHPPAPAAAPDKTAESVGPLVPGTYNLFAALGGPYEASEVGKTIQANGATYVLINSTPMGFRPMWLKQ
jgi:hypothetical protein